MIRTAVAAATVFLLVGCTAQPRPDWRADPEGPAVEQTTGQPTTTRAAKPAPSATTSAARRPTTTTTTPPPGPCLLKDLRPQDGDPRWHKRWVDASLDRPAEQGVVEYEIRMINLRNESCTIGGRVDIRFENARVQLVQLPGPTPELLLTTDDAAAFTVHYDYCPYEKQDYRMKLPDGQDAGHRWLPACPSARVTITPLKLEKVD